MPSRPRLLSNATGTDALFSAPPLLTSRGLDWTGIHLEYRWEPASKFPEVTPPWHTLSFVSEAPRIPQVQRCFNGRAWRDQARLGEAVLVPAHSGYGLEWDTEGYFMAITIDPQAMAEALDPSLSAAEVEIIPQFSKVDPLLYQLALGLKGTLQTGAASPLYAESLSHALMLHLLQHYTNRSTQTRNLMPSPGQYAPGLSPSQLRQILDYIHSHLDQNLALKALAQQLQLSPHHFAHLFKQSMDIAPHRYIIQQRIERAKQLLKQSSLSIADVAYQVGFANQAHLNRHFKQWVGVTPGQYRRSV